MREQARFYGKGARKEITSEAETEERQKACAYISRSEERFESKERFDGATLESKRDYKSFYKVSSSNEQICADLSPRREFESGRHKPIFI